MPKAIVHRWDSLVCCVVTKPLCHYKKQISTLFKSHRIEIYEINYCMSFSTMWSPCHKIKNGFLTCIQVPQVHCELLRCGFIWFENKFSESGKLFLYLFSAHECITQASQKMFFWSFWCSVQTVLIYITCH